ncbi:amidase [Sneathiella aquimaris]|uniref:amidase n=1 Tax=Sneathiella aquimaris TaxID=2599305 RepID=UPI00146BB4D8|nr:amidase [Sneathiella aquimaris]
MDHYSEYDALGLAELVQQRHISPIELLELAIKQTEALNPHLNAVIYPLFERARAEARNFKDYSAPFAGVPFLIKDLISSYAGAPTSAGCKILQAINADNDSELVTRFKKAGLLIFGKTNTPEFGIMGITEPRLFGAAHNPWDLQKSTGGSSGGSAAAVAGRLVPMAHGGDGGGSIRIPSSYCGLVGLLPSRGRNPIGPEIGEAWGGLAREHVLTRSVRDSAAMLDCLAGPDDGPPYGIEAGTGSFLSAAKAPCQPLKIAYTTDALYGAEAHPECVSAVEKTVKVLEDLGHTVVQDRPEFDRHLLAKSYLQIVCAWVAWEIEESAKKAGKKAEKGDYELTSWVMGLVGRKNSGFDLTKAIHASHSAARMMGEFHKKYDVFLTATTARPAAEIGALYPSGKDAFSMNILAALPLRSLLNQALDALAEEALSATPNTQLFNQTGQPAMSLPLFETNDKMPVGVQFAAAYGNERLLYSLAGQLEVAMPWHQRKPQLLV